MTIKRKLFGKTEVIHFIGIGGAGMSGIAEILLNLGYKVQGSDAAGSEITNRLRKLGAKVFIGHKSEHVLNSDVIVYSSAVKFDNPEMKKAKENIRKWILGGRMSKEEEEWFQIEGDKASERKRT